jgi:hypothetical protein
VDKSSTEVTRGGSPDATGSEMNSPDILKKRAWRLSTDRNSQARDGKTAITLIKRAAELGANDSEAAMILAAAQAESGDFRVAVDTVKEAIHRAKQEHNADRIRDLEQHLGFYKKSKPHPGV